MGWIEKLPALHTCPSPEDLQDVSVGSVWQCDDCGAEHVVVFDRSRRMNELMKL